MTNDTKFSRAEQLERAAKLRAMLVGYINEQGVARSFSEVMEGLGAQLEPYDRDAVDYQLKQLSKNKLISLRKKGMHVFYSPASPEVKVKKDEEIMSPKKIAPFSGINDVIQLDLVKSTGRVRITRGNLVIEVGIIES